MMATFLLSYCLNSTVLLVLTWCVMRVVRPHSPIIRERLWKLAAVLPVVTALSLSMLPHVAQSRSDRAKETRDEVVVFDQPVAANDPVDGSELISWNALASGSEVDQPMNDDLRDALKVAVIAQSDEPLGTDQQTEVRDPTLQDTQVKANSTLFSGQSELRRPDNARSDRERLAEGSSHGAVMSTLDWQPFWQIVSRVLCAWMGVGLAWMLARSVWFRSRLRKARRVDRGWTVKLLAELTRGLDRRARWSMLSFPPLGLVPVVPALLRYSRSSKHSVAQTRGNHPDERDGGLGFLAPRLLIVTGFAEPAAFGLFRPTIVLPPSCESLPRNELRAVLAHELAHIARGDLWWLMIGRVLTTVLAFQPLNRVARREWTAAAECLCDAWAVDQGVERLTLARCLTALAEHRLTGVSLADALAAVGSPSSLRTRIERLVSEPSVDPWMKPSRRWLLSGSVIAAALLMGLILPLPTVHSETGIESVPRPFGSGLAEDSTGLLPDGRGTAEIVAEIEAELAALRADLARVERFAHESGVAGAIDMVERLRDRERQIIERWERHKLGKADEDRLER